MPFFAITLDDKHVPACLYTFEVNTLHTRTRTHSCKQARTHAHSLQVQVAVSANDVMDDRTLVRRYRQEAAELRKQLTALLALQNSGQALPGSYHPSGDGGHSRPGAGVCVCVCMRVPCCPMIKGAGTFRGLLGH